MQISIKKFPLITPFLFWLFASFCCYSQDQFVQRDQRVDSLLNLKIYMQKNLLLGNNYTVQIYSGTLRKSRAMAGRFHELFPQWPVVVHYETPNYKVWAGNFSTRLSADRAMKDIQLNFPTAFLFKPSLIRKKRKTSTRKKKTPKEQ